MNVSSEKLKRRDFVAIGFESGLTFANKESSSTEAAAKAHDGELFIGCLRLIYEALIETHPRIHQTADV